jgi:hypothetical protein
MCIENCNDACKLLNDLGFEGTPVHRFELFYYMMFLATEAYTVAKQKSAKVNEKVRSVLDDFHREMLNYIINEIIIKEKLIKGVDGLHKFSGTFYNTVGLRYLTYRQLFWKGHKQANEKHGSNAYHELIETFINNLFVNPLNDIDKKNLILHFSLRLSAIYSASIDAFNNE